MYKAGVTREQIAGHALPSMNFAKEKSSRFEWFVERNRGDRNVYELEALDPAVMLDDLERVIQSVIDVDLFNAESLIEHNQEAPYLERMSRTTRETLKDLL